MNVITDFPVRLTLSGPLGDLTFAPSAPGAAPRTFREAMWEIEQGWSPRRHIIDAAFALSRALKDDDGDMTRALAFADAIETMQRAVMPDASRDPAPALSCEALDEWASQVVGHYLVSRADAVARWRLDGCRNYRDVHYPALCAHIRSVSTPAPRDGTAPDA